VKIINPDNLHSEDYQSW